MGVTELTIQFLATLGFFLVVLLFCVEQVAR